MEKSLKLRKSSQSPKSQRIEGSYNQNSDFSINDINDDQDVETLE